ncbi:O-antigen ligase family protein [Pararhizobium capsulatum]|nr:O-antigen ligase family protein [Pararhizobium capsulatum]
MQLSANQQRAQLFLKIVFWSIVLHAILALLFLLQFGDTILGIPKWKYFGDALGGFINRNSFATFLALGSLIGINMLLPGTMASSKSKAGKARDRVGQDTILIAVGLLILLVTLIATNSRMGVFAALCGMAFSLGLAFFKRIEGVQGFRFWPFLVLLLAAVVFGVVTYGATFTERLGRAGDDAAIRQQLYAQVLEMIRLRPLTGYGGESFERVFPLFHRPPVSVDLIWSKTHSTYLALWSDYGLIFGTLPMLLVAFVFFQLLSIHRRIAGQDALLRCGIGAIVVGAVHSLVDFSLEIEAVTFVFVSILAVACARQYELRNMIEREEAL